MPELSPELQRQLYLRDATAHLSARTGTQIDPKSAEHLVAAGCLQHLGAGQWSLDVTSSALLYAPGCEGLVPVAALQKMNTPASTAEITRRQRAVLEADSRIVDHIHNTTSGDGLGFDSSELAQLDAFVQRHNDSTLQSRVTQAHSFEFGRRGPGNNEPPKAA